MRPKFPVLCLIIASLFVFAACSDDSEPAQAPVPEGTLVPVTPSSPDGQLTPSEEVEVLTRTLKSKVPAPMRLFAVQQLVKKGTPDTIEPLIQIVRRRSGKHLRLVIGSTAHDVPIINSSETAGHVAFQRPPIPSCEDGLLQKVGHRFLSGRIERFPAPGDIAEGVVGPTLVRRRKDDGLDEHEPLEEAGMAHFGHRQRRSPH